MTTSRLGTTPGKLCSPAPRLSPPPICRPSIRTTRTELDDNGSWVNEADYGYVWVPRVMDSVWRPYSYGRWVWYPIIGWTWVSYDSWGWCTDHYGRWGWRIDLGWYWIPRNHWGWGPAWVNWWNDGDYIGWCPLSYYDRPGVIFNNRFYDRYDRYDFRSYSRTLNVVNRNQFQNRRLNGALVGADRFAGRADNISFRADQPNVRAAAGGDGAINARASQAFSGRNARVVERGYAGNGQRLSADQIRSSNGRSGEAVSGAGSRVIRDGGNAGRIENQGRTVTGRTQDGGAVDLQPGRLGRTDGIRQRPNHPVLSFAGRPRRIRRLVFVPPGRVRLREPHRLERHHPAQ